MDASREFKARLASIELKLSEARTIEQFHQAWELAVALWRERDRVASVELQRRSACLALQAEHALGSAIANRPRRARRGTGQKNLQKMKKVTAVTYQESLRELGISRIVSSRAQLLATLSSEELKVWLVDQCQQGREPNFAAARRLAKAASKPTEPTRKEQLPKEIVSGTDYEEEILNHQKMLDRLLRRIYEGGTKSFTRAEGRLVKRLVQEVGQLRREFAERSRTDDR